ncbi:MAG: RagB/SusD family nutrient uptake outer membrane protein [Prolixibacteraceae bacterium]|nr:RagB/SusD family nutrient uptake outer membrane protein [Prolixibacteraceae bacterium]
MRSTKRIYNYLLPAMLLLITSCIGDLDRFPTNGTTNDVQYSTIDGYKQSLVTIYSRLSYADFLRDYWNMQELTTDEAVSTWDDDGILSYHIFNWTADNIANERVYRTCLYNITLSNNFLIEASDEMLEKRGFSGTDAETIQQFKAEARFMRAFYYWILMDIYGNPPFATDASLAAGEAPPQITRADLFNYIETELKEIEPLLSAPKNNEYGRADQAACWALLSRIYLNAEVYTGSARFTDCITYSQKVIDAGYSLEADYKWLMLADNYLNTNEFIFTSVYDNANIETWGGTNYMALGASGVPQEVNGMSSSWSSLRMCQQIPALFPSTDPTLDQRAMLWTEGQNLEVKDLGTSLDGYSSFKFRNLDRAGVPPVQNNTYNNLSDIDFPIFRLAEIYLNYAEAVLRGGSGGDVNTALQLINRLRGRAYTNNPASTAGNIAAVELTIEFILDERARELYWEAHRRTDLVRFNKLTTDAYLWDWKGGVREGTAVDERFNLFPIPTSDLLANPNLKQLTNGY